MKILGVCGAQGALLYRLKKNLLANIEPRAVFHTKGQEQWKLNFGNIPFVRTLEQVNYIKEVDIIIGSPNCGHSSRFSYSRKKTLGIPKEDPTVNLFIEAVIKYEPKLFFMENLPKLMELVTVEDWEKLLPQYDFKVMNHSVSVFGNSQVNRKRLILIGINRATSSKFRKYFKGIMPFHNKKLLKVAQISPRDHLNYKEDEDKTLSMYYYSDKARKSLTVAEIRKLWNGEFKEYDRWPMFGHKMKSLPGVYRNKKNEYPLTLRPSSRQFTHGGEVMGLDEYRIIMGFPKRYKVYFDNGNKTYWLNKGRNTFAKGSVYEIGLWIFRILRNYKKLSLAHTP